MDGPDEDFEAKRMRLLREEIARRPSPPKQSQNFLWGFIALALCAVFVYISAKNDDGSSRAAGSEPLTPAARKEAEKWETVKKVRDQLDAMQPEIDKQREESMRAAKARQELEEMLQRKPGSGQ
ncbi:hypothetical protein [Hydrogenophaga sp. 2FB]|uniref:hypothetical protein n=1 Tax=Hydrogenophaga sp. 2FB TaxID=2502187 RepID=UPI0010F6351B|nr:hypothetical protein [Hydrogenophaga sp. 2FB]